MFTLRFLAYLLPLVLSSCGTLSFYTQAFRGQAEISLTKKRVSQVLQDPTTSEKLARQLQLSQELVDFAEEELTLDASGSYRHYTDLKRDHVVYIVHASPEFSLEPKTWWYPVVGAQDYRGFFKKEDAQRTIEKLKTQGLDTYLGGVNAYSTLGFFNDPLLNTFIHYSEVDLAELIFHELTHHRYYKKNETPFNEALAEVVAREGTRRWLHKTGNRQALAKYELRLQRRAAIRATITESITQLERLYAKELPEKQMRELKNQELSALKKKIAALYQGWQQKPTNFLSRPLNNARLNAFTTYEALVPPLQKLLESYDGDLATFFHEVKSKGPAILEN